MHYDSKIYIIYKYMIPSLFINFLIFTIYINLKFAKKPKIIRKLFKINL
jgi:hypothetical protein